MNLTYVVIFWLLAPLPAAQRASQPAVGGDDVADLRPLVDPRGDDWLSETQGEYARQQLGRLNRMLVDRRGLDPAGAGELFEPSCAIDDLRPGGGQELSIGAMRLRRVPGDLAGSDAPRDAGRPTAPRDPVAAFRSLMTPHRGGEAMQMELKIVRVEPAAEGSFATEVVYHAFSRTVERRVQQNARWRIRWTSGETPDRPRIAAIEIGPFEEIAAPAAPFADCTRAVIRDDATWSPQLAHGCDYWWGRIDSLGEINFMGHNGIAVGDVNGDGLDDVYVAMGTGLPNKLLVQQPDGSVRDVAAAAGVDWLDDTKGVLLIDVDNDGDEDLVLAMGPSIVFCLNDGTGRFVTAGAMRSQNPAAFYSLAAADYDGDGDLDIYGCRYVEVQYGVSVPTPFQDASNGPPNMLLRNDWPRGFADVTDEVGLGQNNRRFSTAAGWADYDGDGDPDLYVSNDFGRNNLYRNNGGKFVDVAAQAGVEDQAAGMGVSWSDFDLDGDLDLYVSNMYSGAGNRIAYQPRFMAGEDAGTRDGVQRHTQGNSLLVNQGDGTFRERGDEAGVRMGRWAWGARFVDFDNDGYEDIVCPNGFLTNAYEDDL
ncbi:MAG: VCBS repeat-containing protein [Phycisphaerae bacterium]|nr:VCBS repeat-containing protein [Phycisphaerae bacterium]NUQ47487.1 VCBS repeat-containing protein [Phycisphaerae bacterium]